MASSALVFFGALFASVTAVPDISGHSDADADADFRDFGKAERTCKWYGIGEGEYCCPHAKHCLKPVRGDRLDIGRVPVSIYPRLEFGGQH